MPANPTPLIHDQRIRRVRGETYLTDKSGYNCLFAASTVCAVVASGEHIDWLPSGSRLTRRMQCWIEALSFSTSPSAMSASSPGSVGTIKDRQAPFCETSVGTIGLGRCGGW